MSLWPMAMGRQTNTMRPEPEDLLGIGSETDGFIRKPADILVYRNNTDCNIIWCYSLFSFLTKEEKMTPEEKRMIKIYERMTDEEIFSFVRSTTAELGRIPTKKDFACPWYLKDRFGPWPRFLEAAGVKDIGERRKRRLLKKQWRRNGDA